MVDDADQFKVFFVGQWRQQCDGAFDRVVQIEAQFVELEAAGLDAAPVEQVVDHRQQRARRFVERIEVFQLFVVESRRSEEHTSELQSLMRISYAVFCLKKKKDKH